MSKAEEMNKLFKTIYMAIGLLKIFIQDTSARHHPEVAELVYKTISELEGFYNDIEKKGVDWPE